MRISKKGQYALLFTIYLSRSGMARTQDVAENLRLSQHFIEQIARNLKKAGIISVKRGPGGGYEIAPGNQPTVGQVLSAVGISGFLSDKDTKANIYRGTEGRTLNHIVGLASSSLSSVFDQSIFALGASLTRQEVAQMNLLSETGLSS